MEKTIGRSCDLLHLLCLALVLVKVSLASSSSSMEEVKLINVSKLQMFVDEIADIPRIQGFDVVNGVAVPKHLQIGMFDIYWKFHRDIPSTPVFAYGASQDAATFPGPTIEALQGVATNVTWSNYLPAKHILPSDPTIPRASPKHGGVPTVVHLHGGIDEPQSDGYGNSWFTYGFKETGPKWTQKMYHYNNDQQPGNLWYHDHTIGLTRENLLAGLIGSYIIRNPELEAPLGLPAGEFDRTFVVVDRSFRIDGSIYMNSTGDVPSIHPQWQPEYFGDAIVVNGKAWPYMHIRRRKYRFRIINASNARFFKFFFRNGLAFVHVSSDSAYIPKPVLHKSFLLAPSEIADVVVDFSKSKSDYAILANGAPYPFPDGDTVDEENGTVMKFIINKEREVDTSRVPKTLIRYPSPDVSSAARTRYITLNEYLTKSGDSTHLYLNAIPYEAPTTEVPRVGTSEVWYVINLTQDEHPLHIHLGLFATLEQRELVDIDKFKKCMTKKNDALKCKINKHAIGKRVTVPAHERGWKNVFKMRPGYMTTIVVRFSYIHTNAYNYTFDASAEPGYVYHCHILDHEDNQMMRPLKLSY